MDKRRDSFTFQRYYFEAISTLKSKEKLELYDAICAYVFEGKDGHTSINKTPKVTGIGQVYFVNLFLRAEKGQRTEE